MRSSSPGSRKPCYLVRPDSALYIGQFDYFIQAFNHWLKLDEREKWFIVSTRRAINLIAEDNLINRKRWLKLEEPRPLRQWTRNFNRRTWANQFTRGEVKR